MWQWWNYCSSHVSVGKTSLTINLDETSICLYQGGGKGNIFVSKKRMAAGETEPIQRTPRGKTRSCMTHVAFICDNPDVQRVLPQVILGNEATFPASAFPLLYRSSPGNVKLIRQKSAWNNELLCAVTPIRKGGTSIRRGAKVDAKPVKPPTVSDLGRGHFVEALALAWGCMQVSLKWRA